MDISQVWPEWNEDCVLGEGSFGKVYRAKRVEYGRTFYSAIKVLTVPKNPQEIKYARSQGMNDNEIYEYFRGLVDNLLNEITLMDNLKGAKNIVGIEDYKIIEHQGEVGWDIFIRMELLTPFDSFVSNPEFSQKDVIRLGVDICTALESCEQNYIVHRDIKPDNIFISKFGEYKLGDFGIARRLETTQANLSRKGTLNYMAPEVYKSEEYGSNVDIYSLGMVLYTLLNNNRIAFLPPYPQPISYRDNEEALSRRLSGAPMSPPCNASATLGQTILKACAYRSDERYQTATEFKNALIAEWNAIMQSGDNMEIRSDAMRFGNNREQMFQRTTNDMTANGQLVVDEYAQGTSLLDASASYAYEESANVYVPETYSTSKSNVFCKVLAWPMAIAVCIIAVILLTKDAPTLIDRVVSLSLLGLGLTILVADSNKKAVGICLSSLSLSYIMEGLSVLVGGIQQGFPIIAAITTLSGVLLLIGGLAALTQREVRFAGSLCGYAVAVEWLFHLYCLLNDSFKVSQGHIFWGVAAITALVWAYGYKSDEELRGIRKILHILTYAVAAVVAFQALAFVATMVVNITK